MRFSAAFCLLLALIPCSASASPDLVAKKFNVDGVTRNILLCEGVPLPGGRPLILVFHGYGGTAQDAAQRFHLEEEWPMAMVAYIQGLTIPRDRGDGRIEPGKERAGW